jgi:hypothetical protein
MTSGALITRPTKYFISLASREPTLHLNISAFDAVSVDKEPYILRKIKLQNCLLCVALIGLAPTAMPAPRQIKPIVRQIDHILFETADGHSLVAVLTETLGLPKVWPQPGDTWTASSGIGFGNVTLEVFHRPRTSAGEVPKARGITSLALQTVNLEGALRELQSRNIVHTPPSQ